MGSLRNWRASGLCLRHIASPVAKALRAGATWLQGGFDAGGANAYFSAKPMALGDSMSDRSRKSDGPAPWQALAEAQTEGVALSAWLGCAFADYMRRTANDLASFARDKTLRDAETVARAVTCRDPAQLTQIQQAYVSETASAAAEEAGRQAEKTASFCTHVLERMTPPRSNRP